MIQIQSPQTMIGNLKEPQLLIATYKMDDASFKKRVVLLFKHDHKGSQGLVINQPLEANLGSILEQLDIKTSLPTVLNKTIYLGGPLERGQGLILSFDTRAKNEQIAINGKQQCLEDIAKGKGPKEYLIALGHTAWYPGQLEEEIAEGLWLQCPIDRSLLFDIPAEDRWLVASTQMGVDMRTMTHFVGHG